MAKRRQAAEDYDSPWKDALQAFLRPFLAFFFADIEADIDWQRGYESLDKEFEQIVRAAEVGERLADKLFKVWLKDGAETWLLIHVEVQGEPEQIFPRRMFDYNCAIRKLYNRDVVSLAVLCDEDPNWRPNSFAYGRWGCKMELTFRIAKLLDLAGDLPALVASENPLAVIVLAHLRALRTKRDPESRRLHKFELARRLLLQTKLPAEDIRQLFRLIDWIMTLPVDLEDLFRQDVHEAVQENKMEFMSCLERPFYEKGRETGERTGSLKMIGLLLEEKFGPAGKKLIKKVRAIKDVDDLQQFARFVFAAKSVKEVRDHLA